MDTHQVKPEAFYSSEKYGEHVSLGLECLNRQVDPPRIIYPVSGTAIRENPPSNRRFIAPHVHRDLVIKAVFLGAPATGKTTLAQALAKQHNTEWMPEYGREYWEKNNQNRRLTQDELLAICLGHMDREEEAIQQAEDYLFIDTNALTTRLFSIYYHGHPTGAIDECANRCVSRYDVVFLCGDDIAYEDTLDRSGDANRKMFQRMIIEDLEMRNIQYYLLHGTVEQRVDHVNKVLRQLKPRR
jgi:NadR type nicotinamide-nucleotide adenylyltransferase